MPQDTSTQPHHTPNTLPIIYDAKSFALVEANRRKLPVKVIWGLATVLWALALAADFLLASASS